MKTARSKEFTTPEGMKKAYETCVKEEIDALVVIGGNGSLTGARNFGMEFDFPVIGISQQAVFFNRYAVDMVPPRIKWFTTSEYVIGIPAARDDRDGYITRKVWNEVVVHFPVPLRKQKKIKPGHYKLYKYKDGFAFKRYEQLEEPV